LTSSSTALNEGGNHGVSGHNSIIRLSSCDHPSHKATHILPLVEAAKGNRRANVLVTGLRAASGYELPPLSGTHTILPSYTVIGQN
jgi:hypothetical protein